MSTLSQNNVLLLLIFGLLVVFPLLDLEWMFYSAAIPFSILVLMVAKNIINNFKGIYLVFLGYAGLIFLDILKFRVLDARHLDEDVIFYTIYISYFSLFIFLVVYQITNIRIKVPSGQTAFIRYGLLRQAVIPLSISLAVTFASIIFFSPSLSSSPLMLLLSFLPKALMVLCFFIFLVSKRRLYLYVFGLLLVLSFAESSRRIYITLFFMLLPLYMSYLHYRYGRISTLRWGALIFSFITFFFFLNFMRAEHDFGRGYLEGDKVSNTVTYISQLKSLDTFYNTGFIIKTVPEDFDYFFGKTYAASVFMFIPRGIWADKPVSLSPTLAVMQKLGTQDFTLEKWNSINKFSLSPGFLGEAWANFGVLGCIFVSGIFGFFTRIVDNSVKFKELIHNVNYLPFLPYYGICFLMLRGDFFSAIYFSVFFYIYLKIIMRVVVRND
ncbi:hypothetical protein N9Q87_00730 [Porticoccaceae bacterium]|nr:hypothetical protein [Porticoccaceae bacterium]